MRRWTARGARADAAGLRRRWGERAAGAARLRIEAGVAARELDEVRRWTEAWAALMRVPQTAAE